MQRAVVVGFLVLLAAKGLVAARLDLFGDEAFYWQCAQRPAIAYVDHPPVTALLVRLGTEVLGDRPFGVRWPFLAIGAVLPVAVFFLARPLVGRRDAGWAAGSTLVIPALAHLGLVAIPDVPMLVLTAAFLLGLERATREGAAGWWLAAGVAGALGLATHYRFVLAPAAALAYLVAFREGRRHWRRRGPWWLFGLTALGGLPALAANLGSDFGPVRYYLGGRHAGAVRPQGLLEHLAGQAILVTPLLYAALIAVAVSLVRRAAAGDDRARLLSLFAGCHLLVFLLASPFETSGLAAEHWPAPGYLALLPHLPGTLRAWAARGRIAAAAALGAPVLGGAVLALALLELGAGWPRWGSLREPFIGWSEAAEATHRQLPSVRPSAAGRRVVVADNYKLGASLEFAFGGEIDVYVLDHFKNRSHGRAPQLALWGIDENGLRRRGGGEALLVIEVSQIRTDHHDAWIAHAGSFFEGLELVGEIQIPSTRWRKKHKIFRLYQGELGSVARPEP